MSQQPPPPEPSRSPSPAMQGSQPPAATAAGESSTLALVAMVISLIIVLPLGLLGFLLGLIALGPTGKPGVKGRNMAVAAIVIGLLSSMLWGIGLWLWHARGERMRQRRGAGQPAAVAPAVPGRTPAEGEVRAPAVVNDFVRDYNAGNDQSIYDGTAEVFRNNNTYEQTHQRFERMRTGWGQATVMSAAEGRAAGVQPSVEPLTERGQRVLDVQWPLRFERHGPTLVHFRYVYVHDHWEMTGINFGGNA